VHEGNVTSFRTDDDIIVASYWPAAGIFFISVVRSMATSYSRKIGRQQISIAEVFECSDELRCR